MSSYAKADRKTQWFQGRYPGDRIKPNCLLIHTTEGTSWPDYKGGATAPNTTAKPNMIAKRMDFRAHFDDERSARALVNQSGGVETNTLNVVQIELVGTCDPAHARSWGRMRAGRDYVYWPEAPDWALRDLADFVRDMHVRHGVRLSAPKPFKAYPGSYGRNNGVRMTNAEWLDFYGVCGHMHAPENVHGDPGALDIHRVLELAGAKAAPVKPAKPKPRIPAVSLKRVQRSALRNPWARIMGPIDRRHASVVQKALRAEGCRTYRAWQLRLGYRGKDADGVPGLVSLRELGRRHGFRVTR